DGELGQRLQPGEDREGEALGDQELGGFRTPGDEEGRREDGGKCPQRGQRGTSRRGQQSEYLEPGHPRDHGPNLGTVGMNGKSRPSLTAVHPSDKILAYHDTVGYVIPPHLKKARPPLLI